MASLVLESGARWGSVATPEQWADARSLLDMSEGVPRRHYWLRARGRSKTTDAGAVTLAALLTQLSGGAEAYAAASSREQAGLLLRKVSGLVERTPELSGAMVDVQIGRVVVPGRATSLDVLSSDVSSAWGRTPSWLFVDEIANWGTGDSARLFADALLTSAVKVPGCRVLLGTTPSAPSHWAHGLWRTAADDPLWRCSLTAGVAPWQDPADLESERRRLPEFLWRRLFECEWSEPDDVLATAEDVEACAVLDGPLPYRREVAPYVVAVDLGLVRDRSVAVVAHSEPSDDGDHGDGLYGRKIVVDRIVVWQGRRGAPVQLWDVAATVEELARGYHAPVRYDPYQAVAVSQQLRARGVDTVEFNFTASSVGRLASTLFTVLRNRVIDLPRDPELLDELKTVKLRETTPGVVRLDHESGRHDDRAVAVAMAARHLLDDMDAGPRFHFPDDVPAVPLTVIDPKAVGRAPRPGMGEAEQVAGHYVLGPHGEIPGWQGWGL
jgi:hypothetical protein